MSQAQKMQDEMKKKRDERDNSEFRSQVGGGMVEVKMLGNKIMKSVNIKREVVDPDDVEMLEDLIVSATNDCLRQIAKMESEQLPHIGM